MDTLAAVISNHALPALSADSIITNAIRIFLLVIGIMAVGMIIFAAIQMITSGGDVEKAKTGRKAMMWGVVGLLIALLASVIISVVASLV